jgi:tetratricopeptide (TPR) repeat protein
VLVLGLLTVACSDPNREAKKAEEAGDFQTAVSLYQERLEAEPDDVEAVKGLATDLYLMGRYDEALPLQEKAVGLDRKDAQIRVELGFNYLNHQDGPAQAVRVFEEAAELEPGAKYLTFLAQARIAAGDSSAAETALRRALDEDSSYGHAYAVLVTLLEQQGRTADAAQLRAAAEEAGVSLTATDRP